ncbi:hypothetical protein EZV62_007107 [Acer yangbiense]|uniref:Uncharacterized protein n=1 Tax=Acer yangbiense TaxID=1000413 RepID=A0A5C7IAW5_9ROSI|nr:hypothetical protein EZV62_007107 [Acer yangbiense]
MKYLKPLKLYEESFFNKKINPAGAGYGLLALDIHEEKVTLAFTNQIFPFSKALSPLSRRKSIDFMAFRLKSEISDNTFGALLLVVLMAHKNLGGIVAGSSCIENNWKTDVGQAKKLIDRLRQTGLFKGLKYTYWDRKLISRDMEIRKASFLDRSHFPQDIKERDFENQMERVREYCIPEIRASLLLQDR